MVLPMGEPLYLKQLGHFRWLPVVLEAASQEWTDPRRFRWLPEVSGATLRGQVALQL